MAKTNTEYCCKNPEAFEELDMVKVMQLLADLWGQQYGRSLKITGRRKLPDEPEENGIKENLRGEQTRHGGKQDRNLCGSPFVDFIS